MAVILKQIDKIQSESDGSNSLEWSWKDGAAQPEDGHAILFGENGVLTSGLVPGGVFSATGGTVTRSEDGEYIYHTFTSSGTFTVTSGSKLIEYLVVAGGGGGGSTYHGAGGGAGGVIDTTTQVTTNDYQIEVGNGGAGGVAGSPGKQGSNGEDSSAFGSISIGGGGGGSYGQGGGKNGGSGGGGAQNHPAGGSGTSGQGKDGGNVVIISGTSSWLGGAGGGGATTEGADGSGQNADPNNTKGGNGGAGLNWKSLGTYYGGGGGGSASYAGVVGLGGAGGGGNGSSTQGGDGAPNTGGGGGGSERGASTAVFHRGGNGGSGIVIIRYENSNVADMPFGTYDTPAINGQELQDAGFGSGYYWIGTPESKRYCYVDMNYFGGAWVLVQVVGKDTNYHYAQTGDYNLYSTVDEKGNTAETVRFGGTGYSNSTGRRFSDAFVKQIGSSDGAEGVFRLEIAQNGATSSDTTTTLVSGTDYKVCQFVRYTNGIIWYSSSNNGGDGNKTSKAIDIAHYYPYSSNWETGGFGHYVLADSNYKVFDGHSTPSSYQTSLYGSGVRFLWGYTGGAGGGYSSGNGIYGGTSDYAFTHSGCNNPGYMWIK